MSFRRVLANLDFEEDLRGRFGEGGPARPLSASARRAAARAGALLRVFTRDTDRLWLLEPLDPGRPEPVHGLPEPVLESGVPEDLPPARRVLAWGEGPRVAALRQRWGAESPSAGGDPRRALEDPLHEAVWHLPTPAPEAVARVAHRGFCLDLVRELGLALPGARTVADPGELEAWLAAAGAAAGGGRWVVKAPYSAAGRERFVASAPEELGEARVRRRLEGLFERHGRLVAEPWVERSADFGCAGLVTSGGARLATIHRQEVDRAGRFRGIPAPPPDGGDPGLDPSERERLESAFHAAAERLRAAGYTGAFGIDAFRWRPPGGREAFHPLCEVNPRLTFGLVARAAADLSTEGRP